MKRFICIVITGLILTSVVLSLSSCGIDCFTCWDKGNVKCDSCNGKTLKDCSKCGGDGVHTCSLCGGTGQRMCTGCAGLGGRYEYDYLTKTNVYRPCSFCFGSRLVPCSKTASCSCGGEKVRCEHCNEHGKIPCPDCSTK